MTQNGSYEYYNKNLVSNKDTVLNKKKYNESPLSSSTSVSGGIRPTGKRIITDTQETDVTQYKKVQVVDENLKPENIKQGVRILGTTGTMKGYVEPSGKYIITNTQEVDVSDYKKAQVVDANLKAENIAEGVEVLGITGTMKGAGIDRLKNLLDFTKSCNNMFYDKRDITSIDGILEYSDTSNVTSMYSMFYNCYALTTIPKLDISNVTDARYMFYNCGKLTTIPKLHTSKIIYVESMFNSCISLISIPQLNTDNVTSMRMMFNECNKLETIDITHYNISSSDGAVQLCYNCHSLKVMIIRSFGSNYTLDSRSFNQCYHLLGTKNSTYNPNGDKDGYIYVPKNMINTLKNATNWSTYADQFKPIYDIVSFGNGIVNEVINDNNETVLTAVSNSGGSFKGWYKGFIDKTYEIVGSLPTAYETPQVTYPFELNENGYYQNTNQKQQSSFSKGRFNFNIENENQKLKITYLQASESGYDYGIIGNVDVALSNDTNTSGYKTLISVSNTIPEEIIIEGLSIGSHFIEIKYRKDGSGDRDTDTLQVKVEVLNTEVILFPNVEDTPYSTENKINIGVVNTMTIEPLNLVAIFE